MTTVERKYILGQCDYNGSGRKNCEAEITWHLEDGNFSMSAGIWNPRHTDYYECGQAVESVAAFFPNDKKAQRMLAIWREWHLNDLTAGTPAQNAELQKHTYNANAYPSHYEWACCILRTAGLNPDRTTIGLPPEGYEYGSKWLKRELPPEVIAEIESW